MDSLPAATAPTAEAPPLPYQKQTLSLMEAKMDVTECVSVYVCMYVCMCVSVHICGRVVMLMRMCKGAGV